ncbi:type II toxin-antitoxin system RelE/ParE family toxin [Candidatus Micrarchaeota archaeon]|nr:type II toxin-antitoxin system RelE/ParE family toxin [Candidatus Micrarchaeota archaeon]
MYEVVWMPKALERLGELDKAVALRIVEKVEGAKEIPYHYFDKLVGMERWRLRIGDYRAIALIDEAKKKIVVLTIGHRKKIYK